MRVLFVFLFILFVAKGECQFEVPDSLKHKNYQEIELFSKENSLVQRHPMYPNGAAGIMKHLQDSLVYPQEAIDRNLSGTVIVEYTIDTLGNVSKVKVIKSASSLLDAEAVRVIFAMDQWLPAIQRNRPVSVTLTQDVKFKLQWRLKRK